MRKKFILLVALLALVLLLGMPGAAQARSLFYADNPSQLAVSSGVTLQTGAQVVTGQCNVQSIIVSGANSVALDYVLVYDGTDATGTAKIDISVGTAGETVTIDLNDAEFGTGVFATANDSDMHITVAYTQ